MKKIGLLAAVGLGVALMGCPGSKPCSADVQCPGGYCNVADGFCVFSDDGGQGGGTGGGTGGGNTGLDGGGDAGPSPTCNAAIVQSCAPWEACSPTIDGGSCESLGLTLSFEAPDSGSIVGGNQTVTVVLRTTQADGGAFQGGGIPFTVNGVPHPDLAPTGAGPARRFVGSVDGGNTDVTKVLWAGWDGGPSVTTSFVVDVTGPTLTLVPPGSPPSYGPADAGDFLPVDPAGAAYRKDDVVVIQVTTPATDLDATSVVLSAKFGTSASTTVSSSTDCSSGGTTCRSFSLDLSAIAMPAFSGAVSLTASGADIRGNPSNVATGSIQVTRWQWARRIGQVSVPGSLRSVPAIGTGGRLFVGIAGGTNSGVMAINSDGAISWGPVTGSGVAGPISVGRGFTSEMIFYQESDTYGYLKALQAADGGVVTGFSQCPGGLSGATNYGGITLIGENTSGVAGVGVQAGVVSGSRIGVISAGSCPTSGLTPSVSQVQSPGNLVSAISGPGSVAYFVGSNGNLRASSVDSSSAAILSAVDAGIGAVGTVNGLALISATRVVGGGGGAFNYGKLFALDVSAVAVDAWPTATPMAAPVSGPVVTSFEVIASTRSVNDMLKVTRVAASGGAAIATTAELAVGSIVSSFPGNSVPTPVLGGRQALYVLDEKGTLFVLPQSFGNGSNALWAYKLPFSPSATVSASPTLDCNRRMPSSQTGVLYFVTESGWLVSYLVDSPGGLDSTAPWPKYARDARNTGNFNGPPIGCP